LATGLCLDAENVDIKQKIMYLKFTDRSMNIHMPHRKHNKITSKVKFSSQAAAEEELLNKNSWVHVNDAAETSLFRGEKISDLYVRIHDIQGCHQGHLDQVEEWINTHHPNNDINWVVTKQYIQHIEYWSR
jgi:hypothetical protein